MSMSNDIRHWPSDASSDGTYNCSGNQPITSAGQDIMPPLCFMNMAKSCLMNPIFLYLPAYCLLSMVMLPSFYSHLFYLLFWETFSYCMLILSVEDTDLSWGSDQTGEQGKFQGRYV